MKNRRSITRIITALFLGLYLSAAPLVVSGEETDQIVIGEASSLINTETKELSDSDLEDIKRKIKALEQKLTTSRKELTESEERLMVNYEKLADIRDKKFDLASQLKSISDEIIFTERQLSVVEEHVNSRRSEIMQLDQEIVIGNQQLDQQKETLSVIMRELYDQNRYPALLSLASSNSLADHINQRSYLARVEQVGEQSYQGIKKMRNRLIAQRVSLNKLKHSLDELTDHLGERKESLALQEEAKLRFLAKTQEEEELYRQLLDDSRLKQVKIDEEIADLRFDLKELLDKGTDILANDPEILAFLQTPGGKGLSWPVPPMRGISAHFKDPSYQRAFGIPHHAVDIRALQNTPVKAAASAYVLKAKDNGYGYSYIVLAHGADLTTVYGHISNILVKEGETVRQGEIIAFSGGMPGSKGAGWLTTGPHLHFEVRMDGKPQNPIAYLPNLQLVSAIKDAKLTDNHEH